MELYEQTNEDSVIVKKILTGQKQNPQNEFLVLRIFRNYFGSRIMAKNLVGHYPIFHLVYFDGSAVLSSYGYLVKRFISLSVHF